MKNTVNILTTLVIVFGLAVFGTVAPNDAAATEYCGRGAAVPPFLGGGVDPNLLLMLDNSASMLDLAYTDADDTNCYDDSYDITNATTYAGYFDSSTWYEYDFTDGEFKPIDDTTATNFCASGGTEYTSTYLCIDGTITSTGGVDELTGVETFYALGNLLNWAAASKLDIQKKILTGGKYDSTDQQLDMETRGCGNRRFVKKVQVSYSGGTHFVTFAVRPPEAEIFPRWTDGESYSQNDVVSNAGGDLYRATNSATANGTNLLNDIGVTWVAYNLDWQNGFTYVTGDIVADAGGELYQAQNNGTSSGSSPLDDAGVTWNEYWATRWHNGTTYAEGDLVTDPSKDNSIDEGRVYIALNAGTASGTGVDDDSNIDWVPYDLTHIEIYAGTATGFNQSACQVVIDQLESDTPSLGTIKTNIDACMSYSRASGTGGAGSVDANNAFNHSIHYCWYAAKHGVWPPGSGATTAIENDCQAIYDNNISPWDINPDDRAYICSGRYTGDPTTDTGYVGRCYAPGAGCVLVCTQAGKTVANCPPSKLELQDGFGNPCAAVSGWSNAGYGDVQGDGDIDYDDCIEQGLIDFCGAVEVPEVVDPSDQVGADTGETDVTWGLPAILTDSGVIAQLGQAIAVMDGFIETTTAPSGLVQEFAGDIRMGAMVFNDSGSASECTQSDPFVLYDCAAANNKDGGKVIAEIDQSDTHTDDLVEAINDFKATSWTPLAEAFYNAIGYFKQDTSIRLNTDDFDTTTSPIEYWCQNNNVLIITEGASTADLNADVYALASTAGQNDTDTDTDTTIADVDCGTLDGSTLLDDLTYYVHNTDGVLGTLDGENIRSIDTHIVVAGTPRDDGDTECSPNDLLTAAASNGGTTLVTASNPQAMQDAIRNAFSSIRAGAAAGSAASVISASRGGEGAAYQAIFWQDLTDSAGTPNEIRWAGEVHALLVDNVGNLYEDTKGQGVERALDDGDQRVAFFFDETLQRTRVCDGTVDNNATCSGTVRELDDVDYLWSAAGWLGQITDADIVVNREVSLTADTGQYISNTKKRYIFTWDDLDADGIVDSGEVLHFEDTVDFENLGVNSATPADADYRAPVPYDFGVTTDAEVDEIINWIRGLDTVGTYRSRQFQYDYNGDGSETLGTWRLGDVVHSTPISVAAPAEGFQFLYRDTTYSDFVNAYKARRHMIYYGGNDGLFHAANGGFFQEGDNKFCKTADCTNESNAPDLGAEMWAYAPYNLLPHLKCLMDENYGDGVSHKYFVDLRPRIFDVRIFPTDGVHTNGWGTILVGGMRFGGAKVNAAELDLDGNGNPEYPDDTRQFTSAWFIFDITDPENPPKLLAEFTRTTDAGDNHVDLAYTFAIPTLVTMKNDPDTSDNTDLVSYQDWYLIIGSGPTDVDGTSTQNAKLAVIDLKDLVDPGTPIPFRIEDTAPTSATERGVYTLEANGWVSDIITVDFDLDANYMADAVYFGTIAGDYYDDVGNTGGWGGAMYRLVTRKADSDGNQIATEPHEWADLLTAQANATGPNPKMLIDLGNLSADNPGISLNIGQPVSASPAAGTDGKNFWIYFGTGRFLYDDDKIDTSSNAKNSFYGIKEPMIYSDASGSCVAEFTWETVEYSGTQNTTPGSQGLVRADQILVTAADTGDAATLTCEGGGTACLPDAGNVDTFNELQDWIAGTGFGCGAGDSSGTDGWYRNFPLDRERNLGQGTLLGGLMTYTTFQPYSSVCQSEGLAYLYGVFYQTGTAYFEPVFITDTDDGIDDSGNVKTTVDLGRGLASTPNLHVGKQEGAKAFVQTSTGTIVEVPQPNLPIKGKTARHSWEVVR